MKKIIMMLILFLLFVNQIHSEGYSMTLNGVYGLVDVSSDITELIIYDASTVDELIINNDLKITVNGTVDINSFKQTAGSSLIELSDTAVLNINTYEGLLPLKGNIAIKYLDGSIYKSPKFESDEILGTGTYLKFDDILSPDKLIITRQAIDFNKLYSLDTCEKDGITYEVISGLIKTNGINTITYDDVTRNYKVNIQRDYSGHYLGIEFLFDLSEWGNNVAYKVVDNTGNEITNDDYRYNLLSNRINASLYNTESNISYLLMMITNTDYKDFSLKIYNPYDEVNTYRYINVIFEKEPVVIVPEPIIITPKPDLGHKEVPNTCAS